jgi:hypothetical protein
MADTVEPRIASWDILSRPCGTKLVSSYEARKLSFVLGQCGTAEGAPSVESFLKS